MDVIRYFVQEKKCDPMDMENLVKKKHASVPHYSPELTRNH